MSDREKMYNDPLYKMNRDEKYGQSFTVYENMAIKQMNDNERLLNEIYNGLGKYGSLAVDYIRSDNYPDKTAALRAAAELNAHGKYVDEQADRLRDIMEEQLFAQPQYALDGDFLHNLQARRAVEQIIEEEILKELVYVANF